MSEGKSSINMNVLRRVLSHLHPYKLQFSVAVATTLLLAVLGPIRPLIIGWMIKDYVASGDKEGLLFWTIVVVLTLIAEGVIQFLQTYFANLLGQSIIRDIRKKLFRHVTSFNLRYYDKTPIGSLVTRVISDIEAVADIFSQGLLTIISDLMKIVVVVGLMFYTNWQFALMSLIPIPLLIIATRIFARAMKRAFQKERLQVNRLNTFVQEHLTGMSVVQIFNREKIEMKRFDAINKEHRQAHFDAVWAFSIFFPVVEVLSALSLAGLILFGVLALDAESGDPGLLFGQIFAFIFWINQLFRPVRMLADRFNVLQRGVVRAERVFAILDDDQTMTSTGNIHREEIVGEIEFRDVYFAYKDHDYVLKGIDFKVEPGQTIGFVGATGAGKTSVINLLGRFYDFQKGEILIGGENIRDYSLDCLRKNIAVVLQDVFLFSDTIHNNITLGNPEISRDQVVEAAKKVGAHEFIMKLPDNYDWNVRERGGMLSVGQRQLISFIRAYVYDPRILILDEATSSVDSESEQLIQNAIDKITEGRTSLVIAHRLSTVQKADKIIVLDEGRIVEVGSHQELLKNEGHYKALYELQFT